MPAETSLATPVEAGLTENSVSILNTTQPAQKASVTKSVMEEPTNATAGPSQPKLDPVSPARSTRRTASMAAAPLAPGIPPVMPSALDVEEQPAFLQPSELCVTVQFV
jgi:hypothetical protein